jgi:hypothetical protein
VPLRVVLQGGVGGLAAGVVSHFASVRVLLLNTEGATAPALFQALTGLQADEMRSAQARWHA